MANPEHVRLIHGPKENLDSFSRRGSPLDLRDADLTGVNVAGRTLRRVNLARATLTGASLHGADLSDVNMDGAYLKDAVLASSIVRESSLIDANLTGASLVNARLYDVGLSGARLQAADLASASFHYVEVMETDFTDARCVDTFWGYVDLSAAKHLDKARHLGPSTLGVNTIVASHGDLSESFMRGCGVPDDLIGYARSIGQSRQAIQWYSCFISYSSKDQAFSQRLHNDLQAAGVRCWFAPEDLKIGDRFRDEIESAIRIHDKLLLVLSEHSVGSTWVRSEVEGGFERESRERKQVLFPVRLDDAVMDTSQSWAADIRRQRHIGDFTCWKDHDAYKRTFDRLLRDLRAAPTS